MIPAIKSVTISTGLTLQYAEAGDPAGTPVLFLHGYTDSRRSFEPLLPHLPSSIRALCLTQRGHGESDAPAAGYAVRDFADDAAAFLDALGIDRAVVAGHSMGSVVAQRFALDHPDRLIGAVLMGAFFSTSRNAGMRELWDAVSALEDPVDPAFALEFQRSTVARPIAPPLLQMFADESLKLSARVWRAALAGLIEGDPSGEIARIAAPVLLQWGEQDAFIGRHEQDALLAHIEGARLIVYASTGHAVHWDEPGGVARDLSGFVAAATLRSARRRVA